MATKKSKKSKKSKNGRADQRTKAQRHLDALAILRHLEASGGAVPARELAARQPELSASQLRSSLGLLNLAGEVKSVGSGKAARWEITAAGRERLRPTEPGVNIGHGARCAHCQGSEIRLPREQLEAVMDAVFDVQQELNLWLSRGGELDVRGAFDDDLAQDLGEPVSVVSTVRGREGNLSAALENLRSITAARG